MENIYRQYIEAAKGLVDIVNSEDITEIPETRSVQNWHPDGLGTRLNTLLEESEMSKYMQFDYYGNGTLRLTIHWAAGGQYDYETLASNKMNVILWLAFKNCLSAALPDELSGMTYADNAYIRINLQGIENIGAFVAILAGLELHQTEYIHDAVKTYQRHLTNLEPQRKTSSNNPRSLSSLIRSAHFELDEDMKAIIEDQIQANQTRIENVIVSRTWGWEVEAPNPGSDVNLTGGVECGHDGSVQSYERDDEDCQCSCYDCTYHDCDCDNCDQRNDSPGHCNDSDCNENVSYEFRTTGGINRALHPGLKNLLDQIADTEKNETAGTHIHVYSKDLDASQVGVVMAGYALTQNVWDVLCGRDTFNDSRCRQYANDIPADQVSSTVKSKQLYNIGKFCVVNTQHLAGGRGTIEFRQMNCNFDYNRISFMGWMVRGLVESAKRGAQIAEFVRITDINGLIMLYEKYGFTFKSETDEIEDPYGSRYRSVRSPLVFA